MWKLFGKHLNYKHLWMENTLFCILVHWLSLTQIYLQPFAPILSSRSFTDPQQNYSQLSRELLSCDRFRLCILRRVSFVVEPKQGAVSSSGTNWTHAVATSLVLTELDWKRNAVSRYVVQVYWLPDVLLQMTIIANLLEWIVISYNWLPNWLFL